MSGVTRPIAAQAELEALIARINPAQAAEESAVLAHLDDLTKPPGSLGRLEHTALRLARLLGDPPPPLRRRTILVFAGDHGVARRGVSAYPATVTGQMCRTIAAGGAAICTIGRAVDAEVVLVDVGVATPVPPDPAILARRIRDGTADIVEGPALSTDDALAALLVGAQMVHERAATSDVFAFGELGIGNTTAAAALTAALLDVDPDTLVGRGTGVDDAGLARKRDAVRRAVARVADRATSRNPLQTLAELGGLEIAALVGAILAAAAERRPVLIDGFIATAAALVAVRLAPAARDALFAAHRSAEPGHEVQRRALELTPLVDLELRLGEGTGAALALPILESASAILREMATFSSAGVSGKSEDG